MEEKWKVMQAIIATAIISFCGVLIETSMNVTFPTLMEEFNVTATTIQWVTTANLLTVAATVPLSAYFIRNFSERFLFILANSFFLLGILFGIYSPTLMILLLGRIFQGIGTGLALPLMMHIIVKYAPMAKRGFMMGIGTMTTSLAPAIGPTYGGVMLAGFGWKSIFVVLFPILILSFVMGYWAIPKRLVKRKTTINMMAFISLAVGLVTMLLAIERLAIAYFIVSIIAFVLFYVFNQKQELLQLSVFRNKPFVVLLFGVLVIQAILLGISFTFPNYLQIGLNQSSSIAGLYMLPGSVIVAVCSPITGRLFDRIGAFKPIVIGLSLSVMGLLWQTLIFPQECIGLLLIGEIINKLGIGLAMSNIITSTLTQLSQEESVDGNSVMNTLQQFSGAISTALAAQFFTFAQAHHINGAMIGSRMTVTLFLILMAMVLLGVVLLHRKNRAILR